MWKSIKKHIVSLMTRSWTHLLWRIQHLLSALLSDRARPLRFLCTGGLAGLAQLCLLDILLQYSWDATLANIVAFLLAAQVNFLLSFFFTWRDRQPEKRGKSTILTRWLFFHSSILGTACLNQGIFLLARLAHMVPLLASMLGIIAAAIVNFVMMNYLVFRSKPVRVPPDMMN